MSRATSSSTASSDRDRPSQPSRWAQESQQALLLELLGGGEALSFAELQAAGIEFPASVVAELELAGAPLSRAWVRVDGLRRPGVRLDADSHGADADGGPGAGGQAREVTAVLERQRARWAPGRRLAALALLVLMAVIAVVAIGSASGGAADKARRASSSRRTSADASVTETNASRRVATPAAGKQTQQPAPHSQAQAQPPQQTPVSPAAPSSGTATQLEASGHQLLESGSYAQAVPTLQRAIAATGKQVGECLQPESEACLTYAYALYDLGDALMLDGSASAAVPVLQERLEIDNQRPVVAAVLARARAQLRAGANSA